MMMATSMSPAAMVEPMIPPTPSSRADTPVNEGQTYKNRPEVLTGKWKATVGNKKRKKKNTEEMIMGISNVWGIKSRSNGREMITGDFIL